MSPENLIQWLKDPSQLDRDSLMQLKVLLDEYPCFSVARMLYLKNLLNMHDLRFSKELIRTAISVPDRIRLYYFVEEKPMPKPVFIRENELSTGEGFSIIDRFLHSNATDLAGLDAPVSATQAEGESDKPAIDCSRNSSPIPASVSVSREGETFTLDYVSYLKQSSPTIETPVESMKGQDLIDAFLADPTEDEVKPSGSKQETVEVEKKKYPASSGIDLTNTDHPKMDMPEETFTETLAKIYLKQKRYDRALEIFKSLSLKYPEKNVYFADQIRYLEKLIINIKNN